MKLDGWETELFGDVCVPYHRSFVHLKGKERPFAQAAALKTELDLSDRRQLNRRDYTVFKGRTHRFALDPLSSQRAGSNSRATAKGFETSIHNLPLLIHFNLSKYLQKKCNSS